MPPRSARAPALLSRRAASQHKPTAASRHTFHSTPSRPATLIKRPHRPYTFTQLLTLSDGSTIVHRTTSPLPVYRSTRDTRNTPLWNPSNERMANVEEDEAGRLRAFRRRFGRGWDAERNEEAELVARDSTPAVDTADPDASLAAVGRAEPPATDEDNDEAGISMGGLQQVVGDGEKTAKGRGGSVARMPEKKDADKGWSASDEDSLLDLISSFGMADGEGGAGSMGTRPPAAKGAKKGRKR